MDARNPRTGAYWLVEVVKSSVVHSTADLIYIQVERERSLTLSQVFLQAGERSDHVIMQPLWRTVTKQRGKGKEYLTFIVIPFW